MSQEYSFRIHSVVAQALMLVGVTASLAMAQSKGVEQRVTALEQGSTALEQRTTALEQSVATLEQQVTAQDQRITTLEQKLAQQIGSLRLRVTTLENASLNTNINVDCEANQTVAAALSQAARRTGFVSVTIVGVCTEAVQIGRSNTSLRGAADGDGLQTPAASSIVVDVAGGAHDVTLSQLTITGGCLASASITTPTSCCRLPT